MIKIYFPYYSGNVFNSIVLGHIDLDTFVKKNKSPDKKIIKLLSEIKKADEKGDKILKRKLKQKLFGFTPCVNIKKGDNRTYENVINYTGIMQLDFDKINDLERAIALKEHLFNEHEEIITSYLSPSGDVKCLIKTTVAEDKEHFKAIHKAIAKEFSEYGYFDNATNNAMLLLFLSHDEEILYRRYEDAKTFTKEDWSRIDYEQLNNAPADNSEKTNFEKKVINTVKKRINDIVDNGHPQVRNAALVLGSRVAAGYIDLIDAENLIISMIRNNSYLQKGLKGYERTAKWGISQGLKTPKYY